MARVMHALLLPGLAALANAAVLFSGGTIVAFDRATEGLQVIRDGSLLVQDDRIVDLFDSPTPADIPDDVEIVDTAGKIITPGFIDTHRHGWQTVFKTLGSNTTLVEYWGRFGEYAAEGHFTADDVYISQLMGIYEALNAGVTTMLDHAHHTWSDATTEAGYKASIDSGARVFWCPSFHNVVNYTSVDVINKFRDIAEKSEHTGTPTTIGIAYDGFGPSPNVEEVAQVMSLIEDYNISVVTTHTLGGPWTITNSPEDVDALGYLNISAPFVFSHASFISTESVELLRSTNQYISITPESEMHYGHTHPGSRYIQDQAALGVDTHFTFSTDILTQARIWLQQARYDLYSQVLDREEVPANSPMSANQAFLLATRHGGLALRRDDLGIIAKDAKADLLIWDASSPSLLAWRDPVAAIILHASIGDIEAVVVDGKFVKEGKKLVAPEFEQGRAQFDEVAERIQSIWAELPPVDLTPGVQWPPEFGQYLTGSTEVVDALRGEGDGYGDKFL